MNQENIKVAIRIRPYNTNQLETKLNDICVTSTQDKKAVSINLNGETKVFEMDDVSDPDIDQENFYKKIGKPMINSIFEGYNATMFTYGQTGSGKTYNMLGPMTSLFKEEDLHKAGIIPRILKETFVKLETLKSENSTISSSVKCSCFEIYKEHIIDLFNSNLDNLTIHEDSKKGIYVENLIEQTIEDEKEGIELLLLGLKNRHIAATSLNSTSSRSHLVFTINLQINSTKDGLISQKSSKFNLIDLAGSERQNMDSTNDQAVKEAGMINKSLLALGNVINSVFEGKFVPFRDSKLTHFLKDSIGGNTKTTIVGTISPSLINIHETISTIKFLQRAKLIKNKIRINENISGSTKILQDEIKRLKEEIETLRSKNYVCERCKKRNTVNNLMNAEHLKSVQQRISQEIRKSKINSELIEGYNKNNQKSYQTSQSEDVEHDILKEFIEKIDFLLNYESLLKDKLDNLSQYSQSYSEIAKIRDKYAKESEELLIDMEKKREHFTSIVKIKENILNDIKDVTENKKLSSNIDKLLDEITKYQKSVESFISQNKSRSENLVFRNDIESLKKLKNIDLLFNKENLEVLVSIINDFVETNREFKSYISENIEYRLKNKALDNLLLELNDLKDSKNELETINSSLKLNNIKLEKELQKAKGESIVTQKSSDIEKKYAKLKNEFESLNFVLDELKLNLAEKEKIVEGYQKEKDSNEIGQLNLQRYIEECETLQQGILAYEKDIIQKNDDIINHRKNIQLIGKIFELFNQIVTTDKNENKTDTISKITVRNSILGDKDSNKSTVEKKKTQVTNDISVQKLRQELENTIKSLEFDHDDKTVYSKLLTKTKNEIEIYFGKFTKFLDKLKNTEEELKLIEKTGKNVKKEDEKKEDVLKKKKEEQITQKIEKLKEIPTNTSIPSTQGDQNIMKMILEQVKELKNLQIERNNVNYEQFKTINEKLNLIYEDKTGVKDTINDMVNSTLNIEKNTEELYHYLKNQNNDELSHQSSAKKNLNSEGNDNEKKDEKYNLEEKIANLEKIIDEYETEISILRENYNVLENLNREFCENVHTTKLENERLKENSNIIQKENTKLKESINTIENENTNLKENICILEIENSNLKENLNGENIYIPANDQVKNPINNLNIPERDKKEIDSLQFSIQTLTEEKKRLQNEINLLSSDFYKNLSESAINKKIRVLMQIKEENYKLKLELNEIKKKNEILEITIHHIQNNNINNHQKLATHTPILNIDENDNENDYNQIKKEYNDILERILCLNVDCKSKQKSKYLKAIDYINAIVQMVDLKKFYKDLEKQVYDQSGEKKSKLKEEARRHNRSVEYDADKEVKYQDEGIVKKQKYPIFDANKYDKGTSKLIKK